MVEERHLPILLYAILILVVFFSQGSQAVSFKSGKIDNITALNGAGLFACEKITFAEPFPGGKQVKVLASPSNSSTGAALWVESEDKSQFSACIYEYSDGSNAIEINWIALQSAPSGAQIGTTSLDSWTTGTECKKIYFPQRFLTPPIVLATPSHQFPGRPQDAMAVWVEDLTKDSFKVCLREVKIFDGLHKGIKINWMAYTNLTVENFTLSDSLEFTEKNLPSQQDDNSFCQKINFTMQLFLPPVVIVTAKHVNNDSSVSECNAITAWVKNTSTTETEICVKAYDVKSKDIIKLDYLVFGDPDPCIGVICAYYALCKSFAPYDARCVCIDKCPQYQEPICSSNGTTYTNLCFYKQDMCFLQLNHTVQHPGSCEGFPFQRARLHMPHIPSLGYSHCEVIHLRPYVYYPDKPIQVQLTVNHVDTRDMNYVHDAAVSWIEDVSYENFTACVMAAGYNERKSRANVSIDWIAYQGAPVGGISGEVRMSQWWTGTTCKTVNFPSDKFSKEPSVFVTAAHHHAGLKRDAASIWLEDITHSSFKICLRELQNYAGSHEDIHVNWLALFSLEKPFFIEHSSVYFANSKPPSPWNNNAFCRDISFAFAYKNAPSVFVSANHTSSGGGRDPMHNSMTAWVEYINTTGARICVKELYESKYDPLSVSFTVMTDICQPTVWSYFGGYCYFISGACASWLNAELNCSAMSSDLVTVHNQEENVYLQHRHNGERSWIGLNDRSVEGRFAWANKEISNFEHWAPQQPNDWKNEDCVHTLGLRHDYTWNDVPCDNCYNYTCFKDLDECATNAYTCGVNAECRNTVGSYRCVCKVGFSGDGYTCNDIDECASGTDDCHRTLASCTNTIGSFICTCGYQYTGDGRICSILVTECQSETNVPNGYVSLRSRDRALNYSHTSHQCDNGIGPGWFRFEGAAGDNMATTCPYRTNRCNTYATGWLNGGLPNIADGQVTRQVCFYGSKRRKPRENHCCEWTTNVQVRNCGSYYVYNLTTTPRGECNLRYCGNNDYNAYG